MLSGRDSLALFNQRIDDARNEINGIHHHLRKITERQTAIGQKKAAQYRGLAQLRLDEIAAGKLIDGLDGADRAVLNLLAQKASALEKLNDNIDASVSRQSDLNTKRDRHENERDAAFEAVQKNMSETMSQLENDSDYQKQRELCQIQITQAENAQKKANQAETDRVEKGNPYEDDPLFMYLWRRRYLTPDYEGGWLSRSLYGWVAGLIDFEESRPNYFMLIELPVRLREHADNLKQSVEIEAQVLRDLEIDAAQKNGLPEKQAVLDKAEKDLHRIDDEIEVEEKRHVELLQARAEYAAGEDEYSREAIELQVGQLKRRSLSDLYRDAQATPTPDDDLIVTRLSELKDDEQRLADEIDTLKATERKNQSWLQEIEKLRRWFRRQNYDSHYSRFPTGFLLGVLLDQLLRGGISSDRIREQIRREQQFRLPRKQKRGGVG